MYFLVLLAKRSKNGVTAIEMAMIPIWHDRQWIELFPSWLLPSPRLGTIAI
ncbi:hypothetical protein ACHAXS_009453 [Conticribra weissflogii]